MIHASAATGCESARIGFCTPTLEIRPLRDSDAAIYCDLYSSVDTMRFIGSPLDPSYALRSFRKALRLTHADGSTRLFFSIVDRRLGLTTGLCSLDRYDPGAAAVEAGIMLLPPYRGRGIGAEVIDGLLNLAFRVLTVRHVRLEVSAGNEVMERLLARLGLTHGAVAGGKRTWIANRAPRLQDREATVLTDRLHDLQSAEIRLETRTTTKLHSFREAN